MEKQLKCFLLLSLKEMALRRVASLLLCGSDIASSLLQFEHYAIGDKEWRKAVEDKNKDKVLKLELPESLSKQMIERIRPMTLEVEEWVSNYQYLLRNLNNVISLPELVKLCWTTAGEINYKRTAEELLHCDKLDVTQRYELACSFCLKDYISLYWEELPEEKKQMYYNREDLSLYAPYCWPHILKEEHFKLDYLLRISNRNLTSFNQWAFKNSADNLLKTAAEYFFQKLTHEEREASLTGSAQAAIVSFCTYDPCEKRTDALFYLLSVMTPEQQIETIKKHPIGVFLCFLYWPRQDLILDNAGLLWTFIPPDSYYALLKKIVYQYESPWNRICFPTMFNEFFVGSPPDLKNCFVEEDEFGITPASRFLSAFLDSDDSESIEVMLRNLDAADRLKLVFHRSVLELFELSMLEDEWHLVEVCLREVALPKEEKGRLKNEFKRYLGGRVNGKFKRFFEFLDETDASSDKREKEQKHKL